MLDVSIIKILLLLFQILILNLSVIFYLNIVPTTLIWLVHALCIF